MPSVQTAPPMQIAAPRNWNELSLLALVASVFLALSRYYGSVSDGFLEADAAVHFMYARHAFTEPHYFVDIWGRPIKTLLYSWPAWQFGRAGVQWMSALLAIASAGLCYATARRLGMERPAIAFIAMLAQPLVFLHSFSELTELPFIFLLCLALWAYCRRWYEIAAFVVSLLPLARPEGFGLIGVFAVAILLHRRWLAAPICFAGVIGWSYIGWELYGRNPAAGPHLWLMTHWPYAGQSAYKPGSLFHFAALLPAVTGPAIFPAVLVGLWQTLTHFRPLKQLTHEQRCMVLVTLFGLGVLVGHSVLFYLGKMASSGELRYMMVAAPTWALAAAAGVPVICKRFRFRWPVAATCVAAVLPLSVNLRIDVGPVHFGYPVLPVVLNPDWNEAKRLMQELEASGYLADDTKLMASHPAVYYFADISRFGHRAPDFSHEEVARRSQFTIAIWDQMYSLNNSDRRRIIPAEEFLKAGWVEIPTELGPGWRVFRSTEQAR